MLLNKAWICNPELLKVEKSIVLHTKHPIKLRFFCDAVCTLGCQEEDDEEDKVG